MKVKDGLNVKIEAVAFGGAGVGRIDGFVVFVPFTAAGDVVAIEIVQRKKNFARARLREILTPSPFRTDPVCPYFGRCGGCAYQHIRYEHQLEMKHGQVEDAFAKIAKIALPDRSFIIESPRVFAYRGKATLHARKTSKGVQLGFMDTSGGELVEVDRCEIMHETINDQMGRIRSGGMSLSHPSDITLWSGDGPSLGETVIRRVKDRTFIVPRGGFFQANLYLMERMVDEVLKFVTSASVETLIELFCGSGLFSVFLAPHVGRLIGVEIDEDAVRCARANAANMNLKNTRFVSTDVQSFLKDMARNKESVDLMVIDPPRMGLTQETRTALSEILPRQILYISCNPATQARDIGELVKARYRLVVLQPLDMFPQTQHIETLAFLERVA
jgi:tRNA/tmRNA/rRNA uracil-C5-methylase (TrmA/RlmC/RlmD family)